MRTRADIADDIERVESEIESIEIGIADFNPAQDGPRIALLRTAQEGRRAELALLHAEHNNVGG